MAFGSAPRREADSQPISQLVRQAVSQTVIRESKQAGRQKHPVSVFFLVAGLASCSGKNVFCQNKPQSNGNAASRRLVSSNPSRRSPAASAKLPTGNRTANLSISGRLHYHSTGACYGGHCSSHCLKPSDQKLLTPPSPPQKKCYPLSGDRGLRSKKIHWWIVLLDKIMILQGVGHQISCLGVCSANDPQKGGGVYNARACA